MEKSTKKLTALPLLFMTAALFMTLRNMPSMSQTGLQMVFFNFVTVFAFLIPIALVSAELGTGWPQNGVFHWVEVAFGSNVGFFAVWLQWIQSIFGITSILAYVGGTLAYIMQPAWGSNKYFIFGSILVIYWLATCLNFRGTKFSGKISSIALVFGVLLPTLLLIIVGVIYALSGKAVQMDLTLSTANLLPSLTDVASLVLLLNFVFGFVGIEVSATHISEVENPQKNYPIALFLAAVIGFVFTLLGAFAIGFIVPTTEINAINGAIQAFASFFQHSDSGRWLVPIIAFLIAMGAAGQVSTWIIGPIKGLWAAGLEGNLPRYFHQVNKADVPIRMLIAQATAISLVGVAFLLVKNVNTIFLVLTAIAVILYCIMYLLMFAAAIRLRYTKPDVPRAYRVPGGKLGIWLVSGTGVICAVTCFFIGFLPPSPAPLSSTSAYIITIASVVIVFSGIPFVIRRQSRKK